MLTLLTSASNLIWLCLSTIKVRQLSVTSSGKTCGMCLRTHAKAVTVKQDFLVEEDESFKNKWEAVLSNKEVSSRPCDQFFFQ